MRWSFLACLIAALGGPTLGCGGRVSGEGDGGASAADTDDGGGSPQGDGRPAFPVCPAVPPQPQTSCSTPDMGCVYPGTRCQAFACDPSGHWQSAPEGCAGHTG